MAKEESRREVDGRGEAECASMIEGEMEGRRGNEEVEEDVAKEDRPEVEGKGVDRRISRARFSSDRRANLERRERARRKAERAWLIAEGVDGGGMERIEREACVLRREAVETRRRRVWQ